MQVWLNCQASTYLSCVEIVLLLKPSRNPFTDSTPILCCPSTTLAPPLPRALRTSMSWTLKPLQVCRCVKSVRDCPITFVNRSPQNILITVRLQNELLLIHILRCRPVYIADWNSPGAFPYCTTSTRIALAISENGQHAAVCDVGGVAILRYVVGIVGRVEGVLCQAVISHSYTDD